MGWVTIVFVFIIVGIWLYRSSTSPAAVAAREKARAQQAQIVCPHCQSKGGVTSLRVQKKQGISGGKATGAVLTGGASMLATGLSRKQWFTRMSCSNCGTTWDVA